jgi:hypothetical protein
MGLTEGQRVRLVALEVVPPMTETLRHGDADDSGALGHAVEYAVLDRAGRLQLPRETTEALGMRDRVRLEAEPDHIGVWPDRNGTAANGTAANGALGNRPAVNSPAGNGAPGNRPPANSALGNRPAGNGAPGNGSDGGGPDTPAPGPEAPAPGPGSDAGPAAPGPEAPAPGPGSGA